MTRLSKFFAVALVFALFVPVLVLAQAGGTGSVQATVTDPSGALVPNATIQLTETAIGATLTGTTNTAGQFVFSNVRPGTYKATVTAKGFKTSAVPGIVVEVNRSSALTIKLQIGEISQTIEVQAATQQLQTLDASVGNVLTHAMMENLPSLSRDVTAILLLQPLAAPGYNSTPLIGVGNSPSSGEGDTAGGQIAGARTDQNAFLLDGSDVSSDMEGTGGYTMGFGATPRAVVPTPVESMEEFRVTTNNDNTFARSAGGEVQMITRRGTNNWHGSAYEFNQNDKYNASLWQLNNLRSVVFPNGAPRPVWQQNRFGGAFGGPALKDKLWFFAHYEGARIKKGVPFTRLVPSQLLRSGILQYQDTTGAVRQVNLTAPGLCRVTGANPTGMCDPRGIGPSPAILAIWNKFEPVGNNTSEGDGLNTIGFDASVPAIQNEDFGVARLDYKISDKWEFTASGRYDTTRNLNSAQVDIGGVVPGDVLGTPKSVRQIPLQPRSYIFGLTGRLTNNITNDLHFGYLRNYWSWISVTPFPFIPCAGGVVVGCTTQAVQIYSESGGRNLVPLNQNTQSARSRVWNGKDYTWNDNLSWLKGNHLFSFSGEARWEHLFHRRNDKVVAALNVPILFADRDAAFTSFPSSLRPTGLDPSFRSNYRNAAVALMGMLSKASIVIPRNNDLSPKPPGSFIENDSSIYFYDINFLDTWRMTPSFTFTYGVGWGVQTPPKEKFGRQTIMTDFATGKILTMDSYLRQLDFFAQQGKFYTPTLAFAPVKTVGRNTPYDTDWSNVAPRLAFAWNPSFAEGTWLGRIFGDKKSVLRGGYGRYIDRINGVSPVLGPALSIGFGDGAFCKAPLRSGACQAAGSTNNPSTAFRIGVDGTSITLPALTAIKPPEVPGSDTGIPGANINYQILDGNFDPHFQNGVNDTFTLSFQRQLPSNILLEVGYVGRYAHHLFTQAGLNQMPINFKVNGRGQTFAQGFDALARQVDAGADATSVTPVAFFESFLAGSCAGFPSCTSMVLDDNGLGLLSNVSDRIVADFFDAITSGFVGGAPPNGVGFFPFDGQIQNTDIVTSNGNSNYHAGYVSVRKQMSAGLVFQANYTYAKSNDFITINQSSSGANNNDSFRPQRDYGPSAFDRRHTVNLFWTHELPVGRGHRFATTGWLDKIIGGWSWSGDFTASSGLPSPVFNFNSCEEFGGGFSNDTLCAPWVSLNGKHYGSSAHYVTIDGKKTVSAFGDKAAQTAVFNNFRGTFFADARDGNSNPPRGFNRWQVDLGLNKSIQITERVKFGLSLQAINALNHVEFIDQAQTIGLDLSNGASIFGNTGGQQYNIPRFLNIGLRIDF